jgi:tyrosine-protein phosphatase YwqE
MSKAEALYLGLRLYELLTLAAIVLGPIVAVGITVANESRRRLREQQTQTLRTLLSTRHLPSDPAYSTAINLIPVDFNRVTSVIAAWNAYIQIIRTAPAAGAEASHQKDVINRQTKLIFAMMQRLGYRLAESDIDISAYAAQGFIDRDNLHLAALAAWPRIAATLEKQAELIVQNAASVAED